MPVPTYDEIRYVTHNFLIDIGEHHYDVDGITSAPRDGLSSALAFSPAAIWLSIRANQDAIVIILWKPCVTPKLSSARHRAPSGERTDECSRNRGGGIGFSTSAV
jgi:hypothetical protein